MSAGRHIGHANLSRSRRPRVRLVLHGRRVSVLRVSPVPKASPVPKTSPVRKASHVPRAKEPAVTDRSAKGAVVAAVVAVSAVVAAVEGAVVARAVVVRAGAAERRPDEPWSVA